MEIMTQAGFESLRNSRLEASALIAKCGSIVPVLSVSVSFWGKGREILLVGPREKVHRNGMTVLLCELAKS